MKVLSPHEARYASENYPVDLLQFLYEKMGVAVVLQSGQVVGTIHE